MLISPRDTGDVRVKACRMVVRKRNNSIRARPSPRHSRFPAKRGQKWFGLVDARGSLGPLCSSWPEAEPPSEKGDPAEREGAGASGTKRG